MRRLALNPHRIELFLARMGEKVIDRAEDMGRPDWVPAELGSIVEITRGVRWKGALKERVEELVEPDELGCGAFGCVYNTYDPNVVIKIGNDISEAKVFHTLIQQNELEGIFYPTGLVRAYAVFQSSFKDSVEVYPGCYPPGVAPDEMMLPLCVTWRNKLEIVDLDYMYDNLSESLKDDAEMLFDKFTDRGLDFARAHCQQLERKGPEAAELMLHRCFDAMQSFVRTGAWPQMSFPGYADFKGAIALAQALSEAPYLEPISAAIIECAARGVLLSDVHSGNVGFESSEFMDAKISDPGLAIALTPEFDPVLPRL
jgi:hypothetical protein